MLEHLPGGAHDPEVLAELPQGCFGAKRSALRHALEDRVRHTRCLWMRCIGTSTRRDEYAAGRVRGAFLTREMRRGLRRQGTTGQFPRGASLLSFVYACWPRWVVSAANTARPLVSLPSATPVVRLPGSSLSRRG